MKASMTLILSLTLSAQLWAGVLPPDAVVEGKTIGDWSAEWWKWIFPAPTNQNPLLETSGVWAHLGQPDGDVFFIAGVSGLNPGTVTRTFTVPEGKYLFFPVLPVEVDNINSCPPCYTVEELRIQACGLISNPRELHASVDGVAIPNLLQHRAISPVFNILFTNADNFATFNYAIPITGLVDPMLSDGYWLMIEPLPLGPHVINFGGRFTNEFWFPVDIVANITVVPVTLEQRVDELISVLMEAPLSDRRRHPLLMSLTAAGASFESGNSRAGTHQLRAFQHKVRAQVTPNNAALAEELVAAAERIIHRATTE